MPKLLPMNTTAKRVLEDFPMLDGATKEELSLTLAITKEDMNDEDKPIVRAIDILMKRIEEKKYVPVQEDDEQLPEPGSGVPE